VGLDVEAGDFAAEQQAADVAGDAEIDHAGFADRVDDDYLAAATTDLHEGAHQSGVVAGGVAADDEDQIGVVKIFERDGAGARAGDTGEADAAGLVAVVATVVDVVGAVEAGEKLQQETGFVAAATAEVPESFVRGEFA